MFDINNNSDASNDRKAKWVKYGGMAIGVGFVTSLLANTVLELLERSYDEEREYIMSDIRNLDSDERKAELLSEIGVPKPTQAAMRVEEILVDVINNSKELYDTAQSKSNAEDMLKYYKILSQATRDLADIYGGSRV